MWNFTENGTFSFTGDNPLILVANAAVGAFPDGALDLTFSEILYVRASVASQGGPGSASADFGHTMGISDIRFLDDSGQVIPDIQLTGANGDVYPYNVPEPCSTFLLATAAAIFGLRRHRMRRGDGIDTRRPAIRRSTLRSVHSHLDLDENSLVCR